MESFVCPETCLPLELTPLQDAERAMGPLSPRPGTPFGRTSQVLVRSDGGCAYPVHDQGFPLLLIPEMLLPPGAARSFDLSAPQYSEAYAEMAYYDGAAEVNRRLAESKGIAELERTDCGLRSLAAIAALGSGDKLNFPVPEDVWVDAPYDGSAQLDAYRHLAPVAGQDVLQLGGTGLHAVKFLLGGAREATVLTPMPGELLFAAHLGERYGVADRLRLVAAVAEELPFTDSAFDRIFSGGCVHHMETSVALPESARVLRPGGRFAAVDPWRAPFYGIGTRLFGKREVDVHCRPLTKARVDPLFGSFEDARVMHHGTFARYLLIAMGKVGVVPSVRLLRQVEQIDDAAASLLHVRRFGSSVALLGTAGPMPQRIDLAIS